jgi:capsular exopolysaccharide synthesis family protein
MTIIEILSVLWRRKVIVVAITLAAIGAAVGSLRMISPEYQATSTLALNPPEASGLNSLAFFQTIDPLVSIYATAAEARSTESAAKAALRGRLGSISVHTFTGSPVFKISARSTDRLLAQQSAQAVTHVLLSRVSAGTIGISSLRLSQIDRPSYPRAQVYPDKKLTYAVAFLLGLGLGIAAAFLRETFGSRIRSRSELADASGAPVYAELPLVRGISRPMPVSQLFSSHQGRRFLEAIRELQTNLTFGDEEGASTVLVTSPQGRHGKSTVAIGLAVIGARAGARTLLVDADLRRGTIANRLDLDRGLGLSDVMQGADPATCIQSTSLDELDVLASGRLTPESGELLASGFSDLLERLALSYDLIVIDTTPLVPVNDARVIARLAKATIVVAAAGKASPREVREAVERLAFLSVRPTAAVLNRSKRVAGGDYYSYHVQSGPANIQAPPSDRLAERRSAAAP